MLLLPRVTIIAPKRGNVKILPCGFATANEQTCWDLACGEEKLAMFEMSVWQKTTYEFKLKNLVWSYRCRNVTLDLTDSRLNCWNGTRSVVPKCQRGWRGWPHLDISVPTGHPQTTRQSREGTDNDIGWCTETDDRPLQSSSTKKTDFHHCATRRRQEVRFGVRGYHAGHGDTGTVVKLNKCKVLSFPPQISLSSTRPYWNTVTYWS